MILQLHKTQPTPDICLIAFTGKLMMGNDSRQVEWNISELLIAGVKKIIFDLSNLDAIDSTGVGILVMCQAKMQRAGGMLCIAGPQGIVEQTLMLTHVDRLVPFFPSADLAAQNFNPS
jgi:anti-sigma B factor antagonist